MCKHITFSASTRLTPLLQLCDHIVIYAVVERTINLITWLRFRPFSLSNYIYRLTRVRVFRGTLRGILDLALYIVIYLIKLLVSSKFVNSILNVSGKDLNIVTIPIDFFFSLKPIISINNNIYCLNCPLYNAY